MSEIAPSAFQASPPNQNRFGGDNAFGVFCTIGFMIYIK